MIRLLAFLWSGCWHRWKIHQEGDFVWKEDGRVSRTGRYYNLRCEHCGNMKGKRL